jgi:hypothetical protein
VRRLTEGTVYLLILMVCTGNVPNFYMLGFYYVCGCAVIAVYRVLRWVTSIRVKLRLPSLPHPRPWKRHQSDGQLNTILHDIKNSGLPEDQKRALQEHAMQIYLDRLHGG